MNRLTPDRNRMTQLLREEQVQQVRQAIESLSDEFRDVVVLREIEGCCYETISEILQLPMGTVAQPTPPSTTPIAR